MNEKRFMNAALKEAAKAAEKNEVPVGAVIVFNGKILVRAHNLTETKQQVAAHAETLAIERLSKRIKNFRLDGKTLAKLLNQPEGESTMFVSLKPCEMCMGAIKAARIDKVIYAADQTRTDLVYKTEFLLSSNEKIKKQASEQLTNFFKQQRKDN